MEDEAYFLEKAAMCRRLARAVTNLADPAIAQLLALAADYDASAALCVSPQGAPDKPFPDTTAVCFPERTKP